MFPHQTYRAVTLPSDKRPELDDISGVGNPVDHFTALGSSRPAQNGYAQGSVGRTMAKCINIMVLQTDEPPLLSPDFQIKSGKRKVIVKGHRNAANTTCALTVIIVLFQLVPSAGLGLSKSLPRSRAVASPIQNTIKSGKGHSNQAIGTALVADAIRASMPGVCFASDKPYVAKIIDVAFPPAS
ncbi:hypothetical protein BCR34DRAFT_591803 [Clohesyomyces aquaticus]|uniref:Uncharacterized protein n=1 Tax=Clohesyomyces aquaticus TaxID=1231657 RepID=A0A1Y1YXH5_9PLEO|nr:hypothetical protein BCR34DRAFT_591803 [Clohesyomyces aquaticus]